jgi:hypothetical protein
MRSRDVAVRDGEAAELRELREEGDELDIEEIALPEEDRYRWRRELRVAAVSETTTSGRSRLPTRESKRLRLYRLLREVINT